ncbi:MAG: hypothetical protein LBN10_04545 [Propionibacteriaceae bacterium]|jgi:cell division protein FtsI/penicillin-binding protein 2|nr:hypothetical protein [Propionibacteriaceae bacterium]
MGNGWRVTRWGIIGVVAALVSALVGCGDDSGGEGPYKDLPKADVAVSALASALTTRNLSIAPLVAQPPADELDTIFSGVGGLTPKVTPGPIVYSHDGPTATASLHVTWTLPAGSWSYDTTAHLTYDTSWLVVWDPSLYNSDLTSQNRLVRVRLEPERAPILDLSGNALVEKTDVVNVGIDKMNLEESLWESSARTLAAIVDVDVDAFAQRVLDAGPHAFVIAITLRQYDVPSAVADVPGAYGQPDTAMLGPTSTFGQPLLGTLRDATTDDIENSEGAIQAGEKVGASGVQAYFDETLRGTPGDMVFLWERGSLATLDRVTSESILFQQDPVAGEPIHVSLNRDWQTRAETALADLEKTAAMVIIRPSDGAILAAANSPGWGAYPDATAGAYAPGSTFKIVDSLALIRQGFNADSMLNCSTHADIHGQIINNYPGYPSWQNGTIPLWKALAWSCNSAFVNEYERLSSANLQEAAGSLGIGIDHDLGFWADLGTVPTADSDAMRGMNLIGQGGVLMNPLGMAAVSASVSAGHTVIPWLVQEKKPQSTAKPLTNGEAAILQQLMGAVATNGGAGAAGSVLAGAKTGTAEWGTSDDPHSHGWITGYTSGDLALCVWFKDGGGSADVGPFIASFLK